MERRYGEGQFLFPAGRDAAHKRIPFLRELQGPEDFIGTGFTPDQYGAVKKDSGVRYRVRFKILELFAGWFGFEY